MKKQFFLLGLFWLMPINLVAMDELSSSLKDLEQKLTQLDKSLKEIAEKVIGKPPAKEDIRRNTQYEALQDAKDELKNISAVTKPRLEQLIKVYEKLEEDIKEGELNVTAMPEDVENIKQQIDDELALREQAEKKRIEQEKIAREKAEKERAEQERKKQILYKLNELYQKKIKDLKDKKNAADVRRWLKEFLEVIEKRFPDEKLPEIIKDSADSLLDIYKTAFRDFGRMSPKIIDLFELILKDTKNWFDKDNMYKGKDVPDYKSEFSEQDFALYKQVIESYKNLLTNPTLKSAQREKLVKQYEDFMKILENWRGLPPTITLSKKYSPLEEAVKDALKSKLNSYRNKSVQQINKQEFEKDIDAFRKIVYRNNERDPLALFAKLYNNITNKELNWSVDFTTYTKDLKQKVSSANSSYKNQRSRYEKIPVKNRTADDYKNMRQAVKNFVAVQAPTSELLDFYAKIEKEEPEELEPAEEEDDEEEVETPQERLEEEIKKDLKKLNLRTTADREKYLAKVPTEKIQSLIDKIFKLRQLAKKVFFKGPYDALQKELDKRQKKG